MNIVQILEAHMRALRDEIRELSSQPGIDYIELRHLCEELEIHMTMEDQSLVPALKQLNMAPADFSEIHNCHAEMRQIIKRIQDEQRPEIPEDLNQLREVMERHFQEIDDELLPALERLSPDQKDTLARQVEQFKLRTLQKQSR